MHLRAPALPVRKLSVALRTVQSGAQVLMAFMEPKKWHAAGQKTSFPSRHHF